jgi:type I restriction-modification system DNA methylase subunit
MFVEVGQKWHSGNVREVGDVVTVNNIFEIGKTIYFTYEGHHYPQSGNLNVKDFKKAFLKITEPKEKTFKERINVDKTAENFADIRQSLDEFFTPEYVAEIMYKLAVKHGYKGGSLLEPSFGHGVFFDVAKKHGIKEELFYGFELYKPNYDFVKKEYPRANLFNHNFEYQFIDKDIFFKKNNIERSNKFANMQFDLVLGNPPYGKHKSPHSYYFSDKMQIRYEGFFIYLALKKLKKDGLLVFIINSLWLQNGNLYNEQKKEIEKYGELIDAYRLPNKTFADTDIATDIVIFRRK